MGLRKPPIWFLEGSSTLTPYNVSLIFLVNHYCADPSRTRFKLGLTLLECIKHRNLSANQLIGLLGLLGDPELEAEFLDYLQYVLDAHMSIGMWFSFILNLGKGTELFYGHSLFEIIYVQIINKAAILFAAFCIKVK